MENVTQNQHPSPAKDRRATIYGVLLAVVTITLCCTCFIIGMFGTYYMTEIVTGINELVDIIARIDVVPESGSPSSPADETDVPANPLPRGNDGWQIDYTAFEEYLPVGYCAFAGGVSNPWDGPENVNYVGLLRKDAQEDGFSWQAFTQHTTDLEKVDGYKIPDGVEWVNDGGLQAEICNIDGELVVFIADRDGNELVQFNEVSFTLLDGNRLLVCSADSGAPGDYNGDCAGDETVIRGISIYDVDVPYDLQYHFDMAAEMLRALRSNYRSGNLIDVRIAWIK